MSVHYHSQDSYNTRITVVEDPGSGFPEIFPLVQVAIQAATVNLPGDQGTVEMLRAAADSLQSALDTKKAREAA